MRPKRLLERLGGSAADRGAATLLSAVLLALALERGQAAVALVALVPFLLALGRARRVERLALGGLLGAGAAALIAQWLPDSLRELGASPWSAWTGLACVCLWAGPPGFVLLAWLDGTTRAHPAAVRASIAALGVFAVEWSIGRAWWGVPWGLLGHSQRDALGVAQLAVAGGVPAVSAWIAAINAAAADALAGRGDAGRLAVAGTAGWLALLVAGLPLAEAVRPRAAPSPGVVLLAIQPRLPRGERWGDDLQALNLHRTRVLAERVLAAESTPVDAIVVPENLSTSPVDAHPALAAAFDDWVEALGVPVLAGLALDADPPSRDRYRSAAAWLEPGRGITARLDKERAIPLLESDRRFPLDAALARLFGAAARWRKVQEAAAPRPFGGPIEVAPLLCYEALFPAIAARRRTPRSLALVNLADAGWLESAAARRRLGELIRFRAIEQRLTLLRVSHGGLSMVVDPFGRIARALPLDAAASLRLSVRPLPPPRPAERAALLALPLLAFGAAWWGAPRAGGRIAAAVPWAPARRRRRTSEPNGDGTTDARRSPCSRCDASKTGPC